MLERAEFRRQVFERDKHRCVFCRAPFGPEQAVKGDVLGRNWKTEHAAHHIMERRLFPDGGYERDNGATVCGECHIKCEQTVISVEDCLAACNIKRRVTPPHLYPDHRYDKWGNPILDNGNRLRGELFHDESVQKVLASGGVLYTFVKYVKYPRTFHLPWSPNVTNDDRMLKDDSIFYGPGFLRSGIPDPLAIPRHVIVTLKMDGENTSMYNDYLHARSLDYEPHPSRARIKALHAQIQWHIPDGWRVCGENLYAKHSIEYADLPGFFMVFSIWNEKNECLPWGETVEWAQLLDLPVVPVIYDGRYDRAAVEAAYKPYVNSHEGYVVRNIGRFHYGVFRQNVAKWVREGHVQSHGHWQRQRVVPNKLAPGG